MSLKSQKSRVPKNNKICFQCRNPVPYLGDEFCSHRCQQLDLAPLAKAFCQAEGISIRDLVKICGGKFQRSTWERFLNGKLSDELWFQVEWAFFSGLIEHWEGARLTDKQIDKKLAMMNTN